LEPERFATTTVGVQGLPALERLLFGDDALTELNGPGAAFRCGLFAAISNNLETIARDVVAGWTEGDNSFLARIEHPSEDDEELPSGRDAAGRLLNDLLTATIAMRDFKLLAPLGTSLERAKPQQVEYWRSGQSVAVLKANVEGLRDLFKAGLGDLLLNAPGGKVHALKMNVDFELLINYTYAIRNITLEAGLADPAGRQTIKAMADHLAQVRDAIAGPVTTTLNIPVGFNALDGD
jgi:predicted lipoprotein